MIRSLGSDPIMRRDLLGMKLIEQRVRVDHGIVFKPYPPELENVFAVEDDATARKKFLEIATEAKKYGWQIRNINHNDSWMLLTGRGDAEIIIYVIDNTILIKRS